MNTDQIVGTFLDFFRERGHQRITGSTLLPPPGDPVLFTTSGMHPLTPYLEGRPHPLGRRLVSLQRCLRTTDLDEVGDSTHLTMFEMLGSWSLGDYDHQQSLRWGYELLREGFGIGSDRLYVTVFGGDEQLGPDTESLRTWGDLGVPVEREPRADELPAPRGRLTTLWRDDTLRTLSDLPLDLIEHTLEHFRQSCGVSHVREVLLDEERKFSKLLKRGRQVLSREGFIRELSEEDYDYLHQTHGLPRDLVAGLLTQGGSRPTH